MLFFTLKLSNVHSRYKEQQNALAGNRCGNCFRRTKIQLFDKLTILCVFFFLYVQINLMISLHESIGELLPASRVIVYEHKHGEGWIFDRKNLIDFEIVTRRNGRNLNRDLNCQIRSQIEPMQMSSMPCYQTSWLPRIRAP